MKGKTRSAVMKMETQPPYCRVGPFQGQRGQVCFLYGQNVDLHLLQDHLCTLSSPMGKVPCPYAYTNRALSHLLEPCIAHDDEVGSKARTRFGSGLPDDWASSVSAMAKSFTGEGGVPW